MRFITDCARKTEDVELVIQERFSVVAWLVFHGVAAWSAISQWLRFKRICAWHEPEPKRMGGNPFARRRTFGLCPDCFVRLSNEIISHGETDLRVRLTKEKHPSRASLPTPPARNCAAPAWLQRLYAGDTGTTPPQVLPWDSFYLEHGQEENIEHRADLPEAKGSINDSRECPDLPAQL
jgi:hypothetical protein